MSDIAATLNERGKRYGNYLDQAHIECDIMDALDGGLTSVGKVWGDLDDDMNAAICMIVVKLARIVNGDHSYADNWVDIAGYAKLVADRLEKEQFIEEAKEKLVVESTTTTGPGVSNTNYRRSQRDFTDP